MFSKILFIIGLVLTLSGLTMPAPLSAQTQSGEKPSPVTVRLKSGEIFKGAIASQDSVRLVLETARGRMEINPAEIESIAFSEGNTTPVNSQIVEELQLQRIQSRKRMDVIGWAATYGLTVVGDLAMYEGLETENLIPAIGPAILAATAEDNGTEDDGAIRLLLVTSSVVQTYFLVDWIRMGSKENALKKRSNLLFHYNPFGNQLMATYHF